MEKTNDHEKLRRGLKTGSLFVAHSAGDVLMLALRLVLTVLLIFATTAVIFACIFVAYIKTNYTSQLDLELSAFNINQTSVITYTDPDSGDVKELTALGSEENRIWIDYEDIPKNVEHAVVAIEDKRFYDHHGVDWYRTASAFLHMFLSMSNTYGGSTLTQQVIKNYTGNDDVTVQRKLLEIFQALELEKNYTKEEIVEWYLNIVFFGHGRYGISAAADYYFGKTPAQLTLAEIASIVGITNNPSMYSPYADEALNKERQETILSEMLSQGYISQAEYGQAVSQHLEFVNHYGNAGDTASTQSGVYTWFEDAVIEDAIAAIMEMRNCSYKIASSLLFTGGYTIHSTINPDIQAIVDEYYANTENFTNGYGSLLNSAIVITDPGTGDIVAMSGGVGQKTKSRIYSCATDAARSPGSSIKPIAVYAPAMDAGLITPDTKVEDTEDAKLEGTDWMPNNSGGVHKGIVTIRQGVISSLNTVAAQVVDKLTPRRSYDFLVNSLHMTTLLPSDADYSPMALGSLGNGVTVEEMAAAYSIFPNMGLYVSARTFTHITDFSGKTVYVNEPETNVAISDTTAYWMTDILTNAASYGTGYEASFSGMPVAGKTGTTSDDWDRWFCGYTPYYVAAVWTGYDSPSPISWSGNPSAQTWHDIMSKIHENLEYKSFDTPASTYQKAVPGVEVVKYTINYTAQDGTILDSETKESVHDREVKATAKEFDGYTLVGEATQTLKIDKDKENIITFIYAPNEPVTPPDTPDPPDPDNPDQPVTPPDNPDQPVTPGT